MTLRTPTKTYTPQKVLDFDIENRPWSYWYDGQTTSMPVAIAWSWVGETEVHHRGLHYMDFRSKSYFEEGLFNMMLPFVDAYNDADIVTGHYIRKHDLPILNGAAFRLGLPLLQSKMTIDTKIDMPRMSGVSLSQENLAYMLRLDNRKHRMNVPEWEDAYLLGDDGFEEIKTRVCQDVLQHKELHSVLRPYLKPQKLWKP